MADITGRYWITYNGEIYNYQQIHSRLSDNGYKFDTISDTEVTLAAYVEWGPKCLHKFRGMFSFAIWDTHERKLFAARDLFGEKPLYYASGKGDSFLIASEIKALIASGLIETRLDLNAVDAYLTLGYVPPDKTIYENIHVLPPGHYLEWTTNSNVRIERYWQPRFDTQVISLGEASERLRALLKQAVSRQMVADVPVGAFLSGGLDSSTIVALMQQQSSMPVKTFSVGFGEYINELPYAKAVAKLYKTEHHEIDLGMPPIAEMLDRMAGVYDEPFADCSNIPTYLISEFARRHVKVVLSGDGGDELFGGYWWYPSLYLSEKVSGSILKWLLLRMLSRALKERAQRLSRYSVAVGLAARWPDMWIRDFKSNVHFSSSERKTLWSDRQKRVTLFMPGNYYLPPNDTTGMNRGFYFDLLSYLPGDILAKVDRAAMAHGLETRAPFLDRDLVEFALSLPVTLKVNEDHTKIVLQEACKRYWPQELHSRKKQGFGAPLDVWLGNVEVQQQLDRVFADGSPLRVLLPGLKGKQRHKRSYQTWILLTLGLWLERHTNI